MSQTKAKRATPAPAPQLVFSPEHRERIGAAIKAAAIRRRETKVAQTAELERFRLLLTRIELGDVRLVGRDGSPASF